jgi:hypothetical protein
VISTLLAALIAGPIQKLQASGELYYGGEIDLIRDTITSLARMSIHNPFPDDTAVQAIVWAFCAMHLASLIFYAIGFRRLRQDALFRTGSYLCILINIVFLSIIVQHHLLGTKYLIDRTALFIIPLSSLNILYALAIAARSKPLIATVIFWSFAVLHVYNFGTKTSLQKSYVWWLDNYNETVIERLATKARGMQRPLRLRVCWILMPSMDYYVYTRYPTLFEPLEYSRDPPDDTSQQAYDYLYFPADDLKQVSPAFIADTSFEENRILYRRR